MLGDSVRRRQPQRRQPKAPGPPRAGGTRSWKRVLIAVAVALLAPFAIGYLLAVRVLFPPAPAAADGIAVPTLVGQSAAEAQRDVATAGLGALEPTEIPHPSAPAGQIVAQSPLPGQQLRAGAGVRVAVSTGRAQVVVPDVLGFSTERAASLLRRAGFTVTVTEMESPAAAGRVIRTSPEPGQRRTLPAEVTLIVSSGPPPEPDPGAFPDTADAGPR